MYAAVLVTILRKVAAFTLIIASLGNEFSSDSNAG